MIVARATPQEITQIWDAVRPMLAEAFQFSTHTYGVDDLIEPLMTQECQLWAAIENGEIQGAVVTTIEAGSKAKVCSILHLGGGDIASWIGEMDKALTRFCVENGCISYEALTDRNGFSKLVPGFEPEAVLYVKKIEGVKP